MKRPLVTFTALILLAAASQVHAIQTPPAAATASDGTVTVNLRGLRTGRGAAIVMLFNSGSSYDASRPVQSTKVDATNANLQATFTGVVPGQYAIKAFYDVDNNGAYDPGTDMIGFSNHATLDGQQMPSFSSAAFSVKVGANVQQITFNH